MIKGVQRIKGILNSITFETVAEEVNEDTKIDMITLDIDGRLIFVYPYKDLIKVSDIPPFLSEGDIKSKKYEIIIVVRTYGTHLIALDFDFFTALFGLPKEEFNELNKQKMMKRNEEKKEIMLK